MALQTVNTQDSLRSGQGFTAVIGDCKISATYTKKFQQRHRHVHVMLVIDASGSMAGAPIEAVMQSVSQIAGWLKHPKDSLSMWTFNEKILHKLYPRLVKKVDLNRLHRDVKEHIGGLTRLNDALYTVMKSWQPKEVAGAASFLVFLTDGGENNSKYKKHQVQKILADSAKQFDKLIFLTAGSSEGEIAYLRELLQNKVNQNKYVIRSAGSNGSHDIRKLFEFAQQVIEEVVVKYYYKGAEVGSSTFQGRGGGRQKDLARAALNDINANMKRMNISLTFN